MTKASATCCDPVSDWTSLTFEPLSHADKAKNSPYSVSKRFHGQFVILRVLGAYMALWLVAKRVV